jgi:PPM family protein phosphatase
MSIQPMPQIEGHTDAGTVKSHNEDSIYFDAHLGFAILADGMGGHQAGEVASQFVVQQLQAHLRRMALAAKSPPESQPDSQQDSTAVTEQFIAQLSTHVQQTNADLWLQGGQSDSKKGMGTTLVAAWAVGSQLILAHVGDSRAYLLRDGQVTQLTKDHSFVQMQLDHGLITEEEAQRSGMRNYLLRCMGHARQVQPTVQSIAVQTGDYIVLASDGLHEGSSAQTVNDWINQANSLSQASQPTRPSQYLINQAKRAGSRDNISVIILHMQQA